MQCHYQKRTEISNLFINLDKLARKNPLIVIYIKWAKKDLSHTKIFFSFQNISIQVLVNMGDIVKRARDLAEREASYSDYPCNQLVHYALTGSKNGHLAKDFLTRGRKVEKPQAGDVVVGTDGKHCGIFVDANHFVHASSSQQKAVELHSSKLAAVFRNGYEIRRIE
jgi:hypothetical protein